MKVRIELKVNGNHVFLDDVEITSVLKGIEFCAWNSGPPSLQLHVLPDELIVEGAINDVLRYVQGAPHDA